MIDFILMAVCKEEILLVIYSNSIQLYIDQPACCSFAQNLLSKASMNLSSSILIFFLHTNIIGRSNLMKLEKY
jgi:hypothetical protein